MNMTGLVRSAWLTATWVGTAADGLTSGARGFCCAALGTLPAGNSRAKVTNRLMTAIVLRVYRADMAVPPNNEQGTNCVTMARANVRIGEAVCGGVSATARGRRSSHSLNGLRHADLAGIVALGGWSVKLSKGAQAAISHGFDARDTPIWQGL
jgi:hypothetical protein